MLQPVDFSILYAPIILAPVAVLFWFASYFLKRPQLFAWASILQCSVAFACVFFFLFGVIPHNHSAGVAAGLLAGLIAAGAGRALYQKSQLAQEPRGQERK